MIYYEESCFNVAGIVLRLRFYFVTCTGCSQTLVHSVNLILKCFITLFKVELISTLKQTRCDSIFISHIHTAIEKDGSKNLWNLFTKIYV